MVERARCECDHKVFLLITAQFDYKNDLNLSRKAHATSPAQFKHVIASALYDAGLPFPVLLGIIMSKRFWTLNVSINRQGQLFQITGVRGKQPVGAQTGHTTGDE